MNLEFNGHVWNIPESWADIVLQDYEKWFLMKPETRRETAVFVADVCKIDPKDLFNAPLEVFDLITSTIDFVFKPDILGTANKFELNDIEYFASTSQSMCLGEYVDTEGILEGALENPLCELLSIVCRPVGEAYDANKTEERKELFKSLTMDKALPVIAFFLHKKKSSERITNHCSKVIQEASQFLRVTKAFVTNGDGIKLFPIWQGIRYSYLTRSLAKRLAKYSDSSCINPIKYRPKKNKLTFKRK